MMIGSGLLRSAIKPLKSMTIYQVDDGLDPLRPVIEHRSQIWYLEQLRQSKDADGNLQIELPDGRMLERPRGIRPLDLLPTGNSCLVSQVNGSEYWDLTRPLESSCKLDFISPSSSPKVVDIVRNSAAFLLGSALEQKFGD